jgi:hypothetical protein
MDSKFNFTAGAPQLPLVALLWKAPELISSFMMLFGFFSLVYFLHVSIIPNYKKGSIYEAKWQTSYTKCMLHLEATTPISRRSGVDSWSFDSYAERTCTLWATEQTPKES